MLHIGAFKFFQINAVGINLKFKFVRFHVFPNRPQLLLCPFSTSKPTPERTPVLISKRPGFDVKIGLIVVANGPKSSRGLSYKRYNVLHVLCYLGNFIVKSRTSVNTINKCSKESCISRKFS